MWLAVRPQLIDGSLYVLLAYYRNLVVTKSLGDSLRCTDADRKSFPPPKKCLPFLQKGGISNIKDLL